MRAAGGFGDRFQLAQTSQQFGIQDGCAGCAANRVVREHSELPVEHLAGTQATHGDGHAVAAIAIQARLRAVVLRGPLDGLLGRRRAVAGRPGDGTPPTR